MKKKLAKLKNPVLWQCVAIAIVTIIIIVEICVLTYDMPKKALKESNFDSVKVTVYTQMAVLGADEDEELSEDESNSENETTSESDSEEAAEESDSEEAAEEGETWVELPEKTELGTMTVADGITYNESDYGKSYFVTEDKKDYVISFVDDDMWDDSDSGHWEKYAVEEANLNKLFDFSAITGLTKEDFEKTDDAYTLKKEENEKLCEILQATSSKKYICDYLKFYFEGGKLSQIRLGCYYGENMYLAYEYHFTYDDYSLELPKIQ